MSNKDSVDHARRNLIAATAIAGGAAGVAAALPFAVSMLPSERAKAMGAPVEADISKLAPGDKMTIEWRGKPVWILRRTKEMLESLDKTQDSVADPDSKRSLANKLQPTYVDPKSRAIKPEYLVVVGICSHLGCSPTDRLHAGAQENVPADWQGGFLCPCHGSLFDLAGRVYKDKPAPDNLEVPAYTYLSDTRLLIGADKKEG